VHGIELSSSELTRHTSTKFTCAPLRWVPFCRTRFPLFPEPCVARSCLTRAAPRSGSNSNHVRLFAALSFSFSYAYARQWAPRACFRARRQSFRWRIYASTENPVRALRGDFASWCGISHHRSRGRWRQTATQTAAGFRWRQAPTQTAAGFRWRQAPTEAPDIEPNRSLEGDASRGRDATHFAPDSC
jgi:hypothetical protein